MPIPVILLSLLCAVVEDVYQLLILVQSLENGYTQTHMQACACKHTPTHTDTIADRERETNMQNFQRSTHCIEKRLLEQN